MPRAWGVRGVRSAPFQETPPPALGGGCSSGRAVLLSLSAWCDVAPEAGSEADATVGAEAGSVCAEICRRRAGLLATSRPRVLPAGSVAGPPAAAAARVGGASALTALHSLCGPFPPDCVACPLVAAAGVVDGAPCKHPPIVMSSGASLWPMSAPVALCIPPPAHGHSCSCRPCPCCSCPCCPHTSCPSSHTSCPWCCCSVCTTTPRWPGSLSCSATAAAATPSLPSVAPSSPCLGLSGTPGPLHASQELARARGAAMAAAARQPGSSHLTAAAATPTSSSPSLTAAAALTLLGAPYPPLLPAPMVPF
ncbi:hypothetical protein V8C86DRAFT_2582605 [Haematococcus lacustris]